MIRRSGTLARLSTDAQHNDLAARRAGSETAPGLVESLERNIAINDDLDSITGSNDSRHGRKMISDAEKRIVRAMNTAMSRPGWKLLSVCGLPLSYAKELPVTPYFHCSEVSF